MNRTIAQAKSRPTLPCLLLSFWSLLLLANFAPAIPQPAVIIGYLWKVEFALAAFLLVAIVLFIKYPPEKFTAPSKREFFLIILPLLLFTIWSGFSIFWAESARNALHHTLLWACYCVFYLLVRRIVSQPRILNLSLIVAGIVVFILGITCLIEYFSTSYEYSGNVSLRFSKYAEAIATLWVIFAAMAIGKGKRHAVLFGAVGLIGWLGIILSLGRTQFLAAFFGIFVFGCLVLLKSLREISAKKTLVLFSLLILVTIFSQISFFTENSQQTTLKRFSGDDQSRLSFQVRLLFWGAALESFKQKPLIGVGGDNFALIYPAARKSYSEANPENQNLSFYEDILPERVHNEYLQILSELGIIGAVFFAWLLGGIFYIFLSLRKNRLSLLSVASFAGISAFLISSLASSYSFRVPANGLCFFFLLALAAKNLRSEERFDLKLAFWSLRLPTVCGLIICSAMLVFSAVRGTSLMYLQLALTTSDRSKAEQYFQKAIALDTQEGSFRYYYGLNLYSENRHQEALPQIRLAIDKGIAQSTSYFYLASSQIISKKTFEAEMAFSEGLRVYPHSIFLRTAFASFLNANGRNFESQIEYEKASAINAEQAKSWRMAHAQGMEKLSQIEAQDKTFVKSMELQPIGGVYALLDFQRQFNPNLFRR